VNSIKIALYGKKIAVVAAMIHGILFSLYGNCRDCRDKIRALHVTPKNTMKVVDFT
jgi:hypothetical protein